MTDHSFHQCLALIESIELFSVNSIDEITSVTHMDSNQGVFYEKCAPCKRGDLIIRLKITILKLECFQIMKTNKCLSFVCTRTQVILQEPISSSNNSSFSRFRDIIFEYNMALTLTRISNFSCS